MHDVHIMNCLDDGVATLVQAFISQCCEAPPTMSVHYEATAILALDSLRHLMLPITEHMFTRVPLELARSQGICYWSKLDQTVSASLELVIAETYTRPNLRRVTTLQAGLSEQCLQVSEPAAIRSCDERVMLMVHLSELRLCLSSPLMTAGTQRSSVQIRCYSESDSISEQRIASLVMTLSGDPLDRLASLLSLSEAKALSPGAFAAAATAPGWDLFRS